MVKLINNSDNSAKNIEFQNLNPTKSGSSVGEGIGLGRCPYLGLKSDPATIFNYPSNFNVCYRAKPGTTPKFNHQQTVCLSSNYVKCPVYESDLRTYLPDAIAQPTSKWKNKRFLYFLIPLLLGLLVAILLIGMQNLMRGDRQTATSTPLITPQSSELVFIPIGQPTITSTLDNTITTPATTNENTVVASTSTVTPIPTAIRRLDTPIGGMQKFIVHQVQEGESLEQYASMYGTTREIIVETNYLLPVPLWVNWLVVIPMNLTEISNLTTYEAYIVTEDSISSSTLAEKLAIQLVELELINDLKSGHIFYAGDVVIIPREGHFYDY